MNWLLRKLGFKTKKKEVKTTTDPYGRIGAYPSNTTSLTQFNDPLWMPSNPLNPLSPIYDDTSSDSDRADRSESDYNTSTPSYDLPSSDYGSSSSDYGCDNTCGCDSCDTSSF